MLPSRGRDGRAMRFIASSRICHGCATRAPRPDPVKAYRGPTRAYTTTRQQAWRIRALHSNTRLDLYPANSSFKFRQIPSTLARFNSSTAQSPATPPQLDGFTPSNVNADFIPVESTDVANGIPAALEGATDYYGFLKDYGLDFGWGPSSLMQFVFEHIHIGLGCPSFWVSICLTGFTVRALMVPVMRQAADNNARMQAVRSIAQPLQEAQKAMALSGDRVAMQKARGELKQVYAAAGVKIWKSILPPVVQIPLGFACWRVFRNMADIPVPGMEHAGLWWFSNLTFPDPLFIIPISTAVLQYVSAKFSVENAAVTDPNQLRLQQLLIKGLPCLTVVVISFAPAAVQLHFFFSAVFAGLTNWAMRNNSFRALIRMAPRVEPVKKPPTNPYGGTITVNGRGRPSGPLAGSEPDQLVKASLLQRYGPSALRRGASETWAATKASIGNAMPEARNRAAKQDRKRLGKKSQDYERRRQKEIEEERVEYERELESLKRRKR